MHTEKSAPTALFVQIFEGANRGLLPNVKMCKILFFFFLPLSFASFMCYSVIEQHKHHTITHRAITRQTSKGLLSLSLTNIHMQTPIFNTTCGLIISACSIQDYENDSAT